MTLPTWSDTEETHNGRLLTLDIGNEAGYVGLRIHAQIVAFKGQPSVFWELHLGDTYLWDFEATVDDAKREIEKRITGSLQRCLKEMGG